MIFVIVLFASSVLKGQVFATLSLKDVEDIRALISSGYELFDKGYVDSAYRCFEKIIEMDSTIAAGYYHTGCLYAKEGKDSVAITWLCRALKKKMCFVTYRWALCLDPDWRELRKKSIWKKVYNVLDMKIKNLLSLADSVGIFKKDVYLELARIYSARRDTGNTIKYLKLALEHGLSNLAVITGDYDFEPVSDTLQKVAKSIIEERHKWTGTVEQKIYGLMLVHSAIKYNCAALWLADFDDWDSEVQRYIPFVVEAKTKLEYYRILEKLVASINDDHTIIIYPSDIYEKLDAPPLKVINIKGKFYIEKVLSPELEEESIKPGMEIIKINDIPVYEYAKDSVYPYIPQKPKHSADWDCARKLLTGKKGTEIRLALRDYKGKVSTFRVKRNAKDIAKEEEKPLVEMKKFPGNIIYFKIRGFWGDVVDKFLEHFKKLNLDKVKGMIIDVRENPGGNSGLGDEIISYLIDKPVRNYVGMYSPVYIPLRKARASYPKIMLNYLSSKGKLISPAKDKRYIGPLVILTSPGTGSAAEDFVRPFKESGRATIIGMPTSGGTGNPLYVYLPGGGILRVCVNTEPFAGKGIMPDILVFPTQKDIAEGKDRILNKALEILRHKN